MADSPTPNTTVTPEAIAQAGVEVIELAGYVRGLQIGEMVIAEYTPEDGRAMLDAIHSIDVPGAGVMPLDVYAEAQEKAFAEMVEQRTGGQVPATYVSNLVEQAEVNIKVLDSVYAQGVRIVPTDEGISLSQNGQEIAAYSMDEINAQRAGVGAADVQVPTITRTEPAEEIPADVRERVMRIEQAMSKLIPVIESANSGVDIPEMGAIDGVLDKDSYDAFEKTMQFLAQKAEIDYSQGCTDEFCSELQNKLNRYFTIEKGKLEAELLAAEGFAAFSDDYKDDVVEIKQKITEMEEIQNSVPTLMADINNLNNSGNLRAIEMTEVEVSSPSATASVSTEPDVVKPVGVNVQPETSADSSVQNESLTAQPASSEVSADVQSAIDNVEDAMSRVIKNIDKLPLGGFADKIAPLKDMLVKPIDQKDGEFDANSQEMASTLLMILKTVDGVENADGTYNERIGDQLQIDILSKDEFDFLRKELGINGSFTKDEAVVLMRGTFVPEEFVEVSSETPEAREERLAQHIKAQEAAAVQFEIVSKKLTQGNEEGLMKLNALFQGLDTLSSEEVNLLDPQKKAAEKTRNNLMFDIAGGFLEKTGMLNGIKDFFTNNAIGQFLGTILGMVGFDVNRLWGEKGADLENPDEMAAKLGDDFERVYKEIEGDNPGADFDEVMRLTKEKTMDGMNGFWGGNAIKIALGSDNKEMLTAAVSEALDDAARAGNLEAAKEVFVERIQEFGEAYKNGQTIELAGKSYSKTDNGLGNDLANLDQALNQMEQQWIAGLDATMVDGFDADAIKLNDNQALDTVIDYDTDVKEQGANRFGDVEPIQKYLYENAEALGLDRDNVAKFAVAGEDGSVTFSQTLDIETCAAIEEMWVKAKLYDEVTTAQAQGTEITAEMIDGLVKAIDDEKLAKGPGADGDIHPDFAADIELMKQYAEAKGALEGFEAIAENEIIEAEEALVSMDTDMQSADGETQTFSVLEQSLLWNQVDITKLAVEVKRDLDPPAAQHSPVEDAPEPEPEPDSGACENTCDQVLTKEPELRSVVDGRTDSDLNPKNYRDLPVFGLDTEEAEFLRKILVEKDPGLGDRARSLGQDPITRFAMDMQQSGGNQYLLMDLNQMGENVHPNFDGVMIHMGRGFGHVPEIRYYDHDRHGINSLDEHSHDGRNKFDTGNPLSPADKDFDTFFSILDRVNNAVERSPSSGSGFKNIPVVTENLSLINGYAAVYGKDAYIQELRDNQYTNSYSARESDYQAAESEDYSRELQYRIEAENRAREQASVSLSAQPRVNEFNGISGVEQDNVVASVDVEVQQAIDDIGGNGFDPSVEGDYLPGMGNTNTVSVSVRTA